MPVLVFRSSVVFLLGWGIKHVSVVGLSIYFLATVARAPLPFGFTIGVVLVVSLLLASLAYIFPVFVQVDGIRCYNAVGFYLLLRWEEIERVRVQGIFGLDWMVASNQTG